MDVVAVPRILDALIMLCYVIIIVAMSILISSRNPLYNMRSSALCLGSLSEEDEHLLYNITPIHCIYEIIGYKNPLHIGIICVPPLLMYVRSCSTHPRAERLPTMLFYAIIIVVI